MPYFYMSDKMISSFDDLHKVVQSYGTDTVIYRGVTKDSHELIPDIGRYDGISSSKIEREEKRILRMFKEQAVPYLRFIPRTEWEWLAIARHHGLPTRLLDWSRNSLVGAYFAVEKKHKGDSVVYAYHSEKYIRTDKKLDPFAIDHVGKFIPTHITPRITAQVGVFTIHPEPKSPFKSSDVDRLIIRSSAREKLKWILYRYGIHRASLFPDLDGLAWHLKWLRTDIY